MRSDGELAHQGRGSIPSPPGGEITGKENKMGEEELKEPANAHAFFQKAEAYRLEGRYAEAIESCLAGVDRVPDFLPGRLLLGKCYWEAGKSRESQEQLEKVAEAIEACLPVYKLLSLVYLEGKNVDKAMEALRKALSFSLGTEPSKITAPLEMDLFHRGLSPSFSSPKEDPGKDRKIADKEEPVKTTIQTDTLADIYLKQGHLDKALSILEEILSRDPENTAVRDKYEALLKKTGKSGSISPQKRVLEQVERWLAVLSKPDGN